MCHMFGVIVCASFVLDNNAMQASCDGKSTFRAPFMLTIKLDRFDLQSHSMPVVSFIPGLVLVKPVHDVPTFQVGPTVPQRMAAPRRGKGKIKAAKGHDNVSGKKGKSGDVSVAHPHIGDVYASDAVAHPPCCTCRRLRV